MKRKPFNVYKSNGKIERFSKRKLYSSLKRSGLSSNQSHLITEKVSKEIKEGEKTKNIYKKTLRLVNHDSHEAAAHYSLKRAIFDLGPTGHHFETYVAKYFAELGYKTKTCQTIKGEHVKHEVDVIAERNGRQVFVECKFHNRIGIKNDIKVALYVKARWDDLYNGPEGKNLDGFYLASNTSFSLDAITYAEGTGLKLLGVNAPIGTSFLDEIKSLHLYPITSLRRLSKKIITQLLARNVVLATEIPENLDLLKGFGMDELEIEKLIREIELLKGSKI